MSKKNSTFSLEKLASLKLLWLIGSESISGLPTPITKFPNAHVYESTSLEFADNLSQIISNKS